MELRAGGAAACETTDEVPFVLPATTASNHVTFCHAMPHVLTLIFHRDLVIERCFPRRLLHSTLYHFIALDILDNLVLGSFISSRTGLAFIISICGFIFSRGLALLLHVLLHFTSPRSTSSSSRASTSTSPSPLDHPPCRVTASCVTASCQTLCGLLRVRQLPVHGPLTHRPPTSEQAAQRTRCP